MLLQISPNRRILTYFLQNLVLRIAHFLKILLFEKLFGEFFVGVVVFVLGFHAEEGVCFQLPLQLTFSNSFVTLVLILRNLICLLLLQLQDGEVDFDLGFGQFLEY